MNLSQRLRECAETERDCDQFSPETVSAMEEAADEIDRLRADVAKLRALIQRCVDDDIDSGCFRKATYEACVAALETLVPPGKEE